MKILLTCETFLPRIGGAEIHVQNLFEQLEKKGYHTSLFTNEVGNPNFDKDRNIVRTPWKRTNFFKIIKQLWNLSKDVDIIHAHYCYRLALVVSIIGKMRGIPVYITLHGMGILNHPGTPFVYQQVHSFYRYFSLKLCTHVISTSQDLASVAYNYISDKKITVILNGYDSTLFNPQVKIPSLFQDKYKNQTIILTVRRLVPKNGIHFLVESMPYILEKIPNAKYLIAGDGRMKEYIQERVQRLKLDRAIEFLGMIDNNDVPPLIKAASVVVFPSTAESSSIACAEAMAMGKMVVASNVGGLTELLGSNNERGTLVDLVDWKSSNYDAPNKLPQERYKLLAEAIVNSINSFTETKSQLISDYAKINLSWEVIVDKTVRLYNRFNKKNNI